MRLSLFRLCFGLLLGLLLTACTELSPQWKLDRLRILAMSAEPAALQPGESTRVSALVVDEPRNRPLTFLWLGCAADPFNANRGPCSNEEFLKAPADFVAAFLREAQEASPENMYIQFLGMGSQSDDYYVPKELFSIFPEEHPQRKVGTFGMVLLMVIAEALPENHSYRDLALLIQRAQDKHVDSQTALFRIPVRESEEPPNQNPTVSQLLVNDMPQDKSALVFLEQGKKHRLDFVVPPESFEEYVETTHQGSTHKTESLFAFFFSSCGKLENDSFNFATSVRTQLLTPNGKDIQACPSPIQKLFGVVRDSRSGQTWHEQSFVVCQNDGPSPHIRQAVLSSHALSLEGEHLEALAELRVGEHFLWPLPAPQDGHMVVGLPEALSPGAYALSFRDFSCRAQTYGELNLP